MFGATDMGLVLFHRVQVDVAEGAGVALHRGGCGREGGGKERLETRFTGGPFRRRTTLQSQPIVTTVRPLQSHSVTRRPSEP